jgi:hypothetical protein
MWYIGETSDKGEIGYATSPLPIHVPEDAETIQAAIDSAVDGNLVLVDEGTYYENINFKGKAITVASHFYVDGDSSHKENTIIDGSQHENPDSGSVVYFISGEDTNSVLCGFTVTGGTGTKMNWDSNVSWVGGGIYCLSGGTILNNIIRENIIEADVFSAVGIGILAGWTESRSGYVYIEGNTISSNSVTNTNRAGGGGIFIRCNGKITDNVITDNISTSSDGDWGGGAIVSSGYSDLYISVDICNNRIENNQLNTNGSSSEGMGGGIFYRQSNGNICNNTIHNNSIKSNDKVHGGGIWINHSPLTTIANNRISSNIIEGNSIYVHAIGGGGIYYDSDNISGKISIYNNLVVYNKSIKGDGGGITFGSSLSNDVDLINNTIAYNEADHVGGGIATRDNNVGFMFNSIVWGNTASSDEQIYPADGSTILISYSDIQNGNTDDGNISADPLFKDTVSFALSDSSLCIGAGTDSIEFGEIWCHCPDEDLIGHRRPYPRGSMPDMGAIESMRGEPEPTSIEDSEILTPLAFELTQNYPNPFNPKTDINYELPITNYVDLSVYNLLGQKVATLVNEQQKAGYHQVEWDASGFSSGIYYYKIEAGEFQDVKKMVLLR